MAYNGRYTAKLLKHQKILEYNGYNALRYSPSSICCIYLYYYTYYTYYKNSKINRL